MRFAPSSQLFAQASVLMLVAQVLPVLVQISRIQIGPGSYTVNQKLSTPMHGALGHGVFNAQPPKAWHSHDTAKSQLDPSHFLVLSPLLPSKSQCSSPAFQ
jgi:hypothetical protein